jgi:large subunit ribosomal protein L10
MALNFLAKKAVVKQIKSIADNSVSIGVAEYRGLSVKEMTKLRSSALEADVSLHVVKNTLSRIALKDTTCECVTPVLTGAVVLGFSQQDPGSVARVFNDFIKDNKNLVVKGLGVAGTFVQVDKLKQIANLPTKDQAISQIMYLMLAPTEKFARLLKEIPTKVTRVVSAVSKQKNNK